MALLQATKAIQQGINPQIFQMIMFIVGVIFTIIGYLITANLKQMKTDAKEKNDVQDNRLNSHSADLKQLNSEVVKNATALQANKENDISSREMFKELLKAELKPIHNDLMELKRRIK
jgi:hypothetical protein